MDLLKKERIKRGIKQKWVADRLGVARQTYANWENDVQELPVTKIQAICELLGINIDDVFFKLKH